MFLTPYGTKSKTLLNLAHYPADLHMLWTPLRTTKNVIYCIWKWQHLLIPWSCQSPARCFMKNSKYFIMFSLLPKICLSGTARMNKKNNRHGELTKTRSISFNLFQSSNRVFKEFFMPEEPSSQEHMTPSKQRKEEKQRPFALIWGDSIALQKEQSTYKSCHCCLLYERSPNSLLCSCCRYLIMFHLYNRQMLFSNESICSL